jgi:hypothetical protein
MYAWASFRWTITIGAVIALVVALVSSRDIQIGGADGIVFKRWQVIVLAPFVIVLLAFFNASIMPRVAESELRRRLKAEQREVVRTDRRSARRVARGKSPDGSGVRLGRAIYRRRARRDQRR